MRSEIRHGGASRGEGVFDEVDLLLWRRRVDKTSVVVSRISEEREGERESYWSKLRSIIQYATEHTLQRRINKTLRVERERGTL